MSTGGAARHPFPVLLVEDDPEDAGLLKRALARSRVDWQLDWVHDGEEALEYLRHQGRYSQAARPALILLDLNMPKMSGHLVLSEIRADRELTSLRVVIFSTSRSEDDIRRSYELHASAFVAKPYASDGLAQVIESLDGFWMHVELPGFRSVGPQ